MWAQLLCLFGVIFSTKAFTYDDELFYKLPQLFVLDGYKECADKSGVYCLGQFELRPYNNQPLLDYVAEYASDKYHFNRSLIHRGYCITTRCPRDGRKVTNRFVNCVQNNTREQYGLDSKLRKLSYCRSTKQRLEPPDALDLTFAYVTAAIVFINLVATTYDYFRNQNEKPYKLLVTWSLITNWKRLTANYIDGDQRLSDLKPLSGVKGFALSGVMIAHTVMAFHMVYLLNPQFLEKSGHHPASTFLQNGTSIVQTFIFASSFLLTYNLLIYEEQNPKNKVDLRMLPKCLANRYIRLTPVYLFLLGFVATWWSRWSLGSTGPQLSPLVGNERDICRRKWWTQILYISNFVWPEHRCLIHTWFLTVDTQLYILSSVLVLALGTNIRRAIIVVGNLLVAVIVVNFIAIYLFELRSMATVMFPENMRMQFDGVLTFKWLYVAPWDSLPSSLIGILLAYVHYAVQKHKYKPENSFIIRFLSNFGMPLLLGYIQSGYMFKHITNPVLNSIFAALDRPIYSTILAFTCFIYFHKIDDVLWKLFSGRAWEIMSRMSLTAYLVHWPVLLTMVASVDYLKPVSVLEITGHFLSTFLITYTVSLPIYLLVELPTSRFLQSLFS